LLGISDLDFEWLCDSDFWAAEKGRRALGALVGLEISEALDFDRFECSVTFGLIGLLISFLVSYLGFDGGC